ncbi:MAG TPA: hypothetical protein VHW43_13460 [Puia sp.]|nr:hypothetical protein [Puia sp.]
MKIYYYSEAVGMIKHRRVGLLPFLIHWLEKVAKYAPLVATGDAFLYDFFPVGLPVHVRYAAIIILAYVLYNALVFCNGWMIALASRESPDWKIIFGGCFIYTFGATAISVYMLLQRYFPAHPMICVNIALCLAYFVYTRFHFLKDEAPPACAWIYKAGLRTGG